MGGLVYLEGSDALGRKMEAEFTRKNADLPPEERISAYNKHVASGGWISKDLPALASLIDGKWLLANYEAGDMVVHSPFMIHASTVNFDAQQRMRTHPPLRIRMMEPRANTTQHSTPTAHYHNAMVLIMRSTRSPVPIPSG